MAAQDFKALAARWQASPDSPLDDVLCVGGTQLAAGKRIKLQLQMVLNDLLRIWLNTQPSNSIHNWHRVGDVRALVALLTKSYMPSLDSDSLLRVCKTVRGCEPLKGFARRSRPPP